MSPPRIRPWLTAAAAGLVGLVVGATLSLGAQSARSQPIPIFTLPPTVSPSVDPAVDLVPKDLRTRPIEDTTFLAWTPGGLTPGFDASATKLRGISDVVVVASDTTWMARSFDTDHRLVDDPRPPFDIPIEASSVRPRDFEGFLAPQYRSVIAQLADGEGVISESSAKVRGIGEGGVMEMRVAQHPSRTVPIRIAAVLPDVFVGATELLVASEVGAPLGVNNDRYALMIPRGQPSDEQLENQLRTFISADTPLQVREPGDTPYPRHGDAVLPQVMLKLQFGEFAARPRPGDPGNLQIDPRWRKQNIRLVHLPLVGDVQCHKDVLPQLRGILGELIDRSHSDVIHTEHGCYVPKFMSNVPNSSVSHHAWGVAIDFNLAGNAFGATPHQPKALVRTMERWGFVWGGDWITPDGNHFEWHGPPKEPAASG
ncbi:MAG: M15 family metallopeptidase [Actinomycetota bacterium]